MPASLPAVRVGAGTSKATGVLRIGMRFPMAGECSDARDSSHAKMPQAGGTKNDEREGTTVQQNVHVQYDWSGRRCYSTVAQATGWKNASEQVQATIERLAEHSASEGATVFPSAPASRLLACLVSSVRPLLAYNLPDSLRPVRHVEKRVSPGSLRDSQGHESDFQGL